MKRSGMFFFLAAIISACNLPGGGEFDSQLATSAALTVQASVSNPPLENPGSPQGGDAQITPTFSNPVVSVSEVTNCRSGPNTAYERVTQVVPGQQVKIIGYYPPIYWLVDTPQGECWLYGEFATPAGSFESVPTVTAPPTPIGTAPQAPTFLAANGWTYFCNSNGVADITLSWSDKSNNESGYRILRNGNAVAELPANSTYFAESINLLSGQSVGYQVQAYNLIGESSSSIATMKCP